MTPPPYIVPAQARALVDALRQVAEDAGPEARQLMLGPIMADRELLIQTRTRVGAGYLLGVLGGRIFMLRELGILTETEADYAYEKVRFLFDKHWPSLVEAVS